MRETTTTAHHEDGIILPANEKETTPRLEVETLKNDYNFVCLIYIHVAVILDYYGILRQVTMRLA